MEAMLVMCIEPGKDAGKFGNVGDREVGEESAAWKDM